MFASAIGRQKLGEEVARRHENLFHTRSQSPHNPVVDAPFNTFLRPIKSVVVEVGDVSTIANGVNLPKSGLGFSITRIGSEDTGLETCTV
jgi:hypothetical protein